MSEEDVVEPGQVGQRVPGAVVTEHRGDLVVGEVAARTEM